MKRREVANLLACTALTCAALACAGSARSAEPPAAERDAAYEVKPGDTLYGLAARYLTRLGDAREVQRVNRIRNPRRLPIGRVLTIPAPLLRTEPVVGRLVAYSGEVSVAGPGAGALRLQMEVREGFELATGANAFLTVGLPDESRVTLPSQSRARLQRLRRVVLTGAVQRDLRVVAGRANAVVTPMTDEASRFRILTPVAVSAVRGTEFRVRHDDSADRSTVEVLEGRVAETGLTPGAESLVGAGFGAAVTQEAVSPPVALLPPPSSTAPGRLQDEPSLMFEVAPMPGAAAYRAQIARDAGFVDLAAETTATEPRLVFDSWPNGGFFVRFTALDPTGLEGLPATYAFERRLNALGLDPPGAIPGARRQYLFKWTSSGAGSESFRFVLGRRPDASDPVIDAPGLARSEITVADLPAGVYYWRVQVVRREEGRVFEKWSPAQKFEIGR